MQAIQVQGFHAVTPKKDCPHCTEENIINAKMCEGIHVDDPCLKCGNKGENWICLHPSCKEIYCSRYVNSDMVAHNAEKKHPICFSFADFSFWCYECDSYVEHELLNHTKFFYLQKFAETDTDKQVFEKMRASKHEAVLNECDADLEDDDEEQKTAPATKNEIEAELAELTDKVANMGISIGKMPESIEFTYNKLVSGIKEGKFKKICVLTGAGISVSAGIPDFRSPDTGIYANLQKYNIPSPECLFTIDYFNENPQAFYSFSKNFDMDSFIPTPTHYFMKLLQDKGILLKYLTQNIDNLEEQTGLDMNEYVIQCHGANRGASCGKCKAPADFEQLKDHIKKGLIYWCPKCKKDDKRFPVKPDIVFFGEQLPSDFHDFSSTKVKEVDLCLVIGTALAVSPVNMIPYMVPKNCKLALFNLDNTDKTGTVDFEKRKDKHLFVQGKCDETLTKLVHDLGWEKEFNDLLPECHKQK